MTDRQTDRERERESLSNVIFIGVWWSWSNDQVLGRIGSKQLTSCIFLHIAHHCVSLQSHPSKYLLFHLSRESESEDEDTGKPLTTDELRTRAMKGVSNYFGFLLLLGGGGSGERVWWSTFATTNINFYLHDIPYSRNYWRDWIWWLSPKSLLQQYWRILIWWIGTGSP